jgi:hypothetical protein
VPLYHPPQRVRSQRVRLGARRFAPATRAAPHGKYRVAWNRTSSGDVVRAHFARRRVCPRATALAVGRALGSCFLVIGHALTLTPAVDRWLADTAGVSPIRTRDHDPAAARTLRPLHRRRRCVHR